MSYIFSYSLEYGRIIPACMIDARVGTNLENALGTVIKSVTDAQVNLIDDNVLFYKIETIQGNLVGYFSIKVNPNTGAGNLFIQTIRPAFNDNLLEINEQISNFILNGAWQSDYLFSSTQ